MKVLRNLVLSVAMVCMLAVPVLADVWVHPYQRSNGTEVQGYHRTSPNSTPYDNYSTHGNVNPYTGKEGSTNPSW